MKTFALLEDYVTDFKDPKKNWEALCQAIETGKPVFLTDNIQVEGWTHLTTKDIKITGHNKETCGLIFLTQISKKKGNFAYDVSTIKPTSSGVFNIGLSIDFSNISLTSAHYHKYADKGLEEYFGDNYKRNGKQYLYRERLDNSVIAVDHVSIKNCNILGDLVIAYEPTETMRFLTADNGKNDKKGTRLGIQKVNFENNYMHLTNSFLLVSAFPNEVHIYNNVLKDCIGVAVWTSFCKSTYAIGNTFENSFVLQPHMLSLRTHYCTLVLCQGGTLYGRNNKYKNLLGVGPEVEIYPYYVLGRGNVDWQDNDMFNVAFSATAVKQLSCLIKVKNSLNLVYKRNRVVVEQEAFDKIGFDGEGFSTIIGSSRHYEDGSICDISDNYFEVPYINQESFVTNSKHNISRNTFVIGKINNDTIFEDRNGNRDYLNFTENELKIGEVEGGYLNLFNTMGTNTDKVLFKDNTFTFEEPCIVGFGDNHKSGHFQNGLNTKLFEGSGNTINKGTITTGLFPNFNEVGYPYTLKLDYSQIVAENYSNGTSYIKTMEGIGKSYMRVENNKSEDVGLISIRDKDFTYNGANEFFIKGKVIFTILVSDKEGNYEYEIEIQDINSLIFGDQKVKVINRKENITTIIPEKKGNITRFTLTHETNGKSAFIGLKGMESIKAFDVSVSMRIK